MNKQYILNKETNKIELHFDKADYLALTAEQKSSLKSAYLWSSKAGAWVSRSTNNHYSAIRTAEALGFTKGESIRERLSYAEELERKAEKAEARAERYEDYAINAQQRAKQLQSVMDQHRGDIAFFTQPIIAGHSGSRAFANYRDKLFRRYDKGFEEYQKSAYYQDRAETARATADNDKLKNKVYLHNRIKEQEKTLKQLQKNIVYYENNLYRLEQGEELKAWDGHLITAEKTEEAITEQLEKYDYEQGKLEFFEKCLSDLGGVEFSKENIKVGYIVRLSTENHCEVVSAGSVNITYKILTGGAKGMILTEPYAAITKIIEAKEIKQGIENPYTTGDVLCSHRPADDSIFRAYQVIKTTASGVKLQRIRITDGKPIKDDFVSEEQMQKKIVKSKWSEFVGVYVDDWQLHKYNDKAV
jgi:hypothetical protein